MLSFVANQISQIIALVKRFQSSKPKTRTPYARHSKNQLGKSQFMVPLRFEENELRFGKGALNKQMVHNFNHRMIDNTCNNKKLVVFA